MTPYSNLDRRLTEEEWLALREWLEANPDHRTHLGDTREDGRAFIGYNKDSKGGELWGTQQRVLDIRARVRQNYALKTGADPQYLETLLAQRQTRRVSDTEFRERDRRYKLEWKKAHPEIEGAYKARVRLRRSGLAHALHPDSDEDACIPFYALAIGRTKSLGQRHCVDHIIPLTYGGWHHHKNLQVLPQPINQSKNNNPFWEHPDYRSWRNVPRELWPARLVPIYSTLLNFPPIYEERYDRTVTGKSDPTTDTLEKCPV